MTVDDAKVADFGVFRLFAAEGSLWERLPQPALKHFQISCRTAGRNLDTV
jgi:hypothetical protein